MIFKKRKEKKNRGNKHPKKNKDRKVTNNTNSIKNNIAVFGATGAGKTVYLAVLFHELKTRKLKDYLSLDTMTKYGESYTYLQELNKMIYEQQIWPPPTFKGRFQRIVFGLRYNLLYREKFGELAFTVSTNDVSGEDLQELYDPEIIAEDFTKPLDPKMQALFNRQEEIISESKAFIFLLDPLTEVTTAGERPERMKKQKVLLRNLLYMICKMNQEQKNNDLTIFLCVSKNDEEELPEEKVDDYFRDKYLLPCLLAKSITDDVVYCALSSTGGKIVKTIDGETVSMPPPKSNIKPSNVLFPIKYLLYKEGVIEQEEEVFEQEVLEKE
ncbi:MAG: hypothetical protein GF364_16745 [Candidatus Lokiarchaeota archaeon]|nr:hypothetical protein [Candidatus Lokiarchaeota archaeon]